jgi:hypothetical protein
MLFSSNPKISYFPQGALVPFNGEWNLEDKVWALEVIATKMSLPLALLSREVGKVCRYATNIYTHICNYFCVYPTYVCVRVWVCK